MTSENIQFLVLPVKLCFTLCKLRYRTDEELIQNLIWKKSLGSASLRKSRSFSIRTSYRTRWTSHLKWFVKFLFGEKLVTPEALVIMLFIISLKYIIFEDIKAVELFCSSCFKKLHVVYARYITWWIKNKPTLIMI